MNRYQPKTFRPALGFASAALLSALTLSMAVILPAGICATSECTTLAGDATPAARQVTISPSRIDVFGQRTTDLADTRNASRG